jgi:DNA-binding beta-propeller fold protein YncE
VVVEYDFFIAHAEKDIATAERLFESLHAKSGVFLDSRCLRPGDDWDQALPAAQRQSKVTVVLISTSTERAFYQREEIAAAIDLARKNPESHRVVPVYLDGPPDGVSDVPYGLRLKHAIVIDTATTLAAAAAQLLDLRFPTEVAVLHLAGTRLGADLAREVRGPRPDLLVVSGDLAKSGMPSEFAHALRFLEQLSEDLHLPRRHVVIVPGTHDVNRKACRAYFSRCDADEEEPVPPFWPKWRHFSAMVHEFYRDEPSIRFEVDEPWTLFEMPDLQVVVAGLNSTIAESHRDEDHYGFLGQAQLRWFAERLATFEERGWLRIGVVHHHSLRDADDFEHILAPRLNRVLYGQQVSEPYETLRIPSDTVAQSRPEHDYGIDLGRARDDFLTRVEEVCALRHPGAMITRARSDAQPPVEYLRVTTVGRQYPVGASEHGIDAEAVARFVECVHHTFRPADPGVTSELVYGGPPAPRTLVERARRQGVRLTSFIAYQGVLDLRECVDRQIERLVRDRIYPPQLYVPQRYTLIERRETGIEHDLLGTVMQWLGETPGRFVLVLGEFGAGKTFLLRELARRLPCELPDLVPLLLELRKLEKARTVEELAAQHLTAQGEPFDPEKFRYMLREGRVVLLFDGFDELAFRVTYERATAHLEALLDAAQGQAKLVVTSRTEHFLSDEQVRTAIGERVELLAGRRLVRLEEFDDGQVRAFLVNLFEGDQARADIRLELIHDVRDLLGLSRNPRMASFIAALEEDQLREARARHGAITSAELYRLLLERWLEHEYERAQPRGGAPTLSVDERWRAVTGLALRLWETTERAVRLPDLTGAAAEVIDQMADRPLDEDQAAHVVGSGTLLVRDEEGSFSFVHSSVMEWLVANHAAEQLASGETDPEVLGRRELSALMADFLCGLAGRARAQTWATRVLGAPAGAETTKRNALLVLDRMGERAEAGVQLQGKKLRGQTFSSAQDLSGANLRGADLIDARLVGVNLSGADLAGAKLVGARLDRADLSHANLTGADLTGARLLGADLRGAALAASVWRRARLIGARVDPGALDECDTWGAALPDIERVELQTDHGSTACASVTFSPDSGLLVAGSTDGVVGVWNTTSGKLVRALKDHTGRIWSVGFSPDSRWLATADANGVVRVWDAASGELIHTLEAQNRPVWSVGFSPDSRWLATAGDSRMVRLWDAASGELTRTLQATGPVVSVGFSPDSRWLATADANGVVRVWDAASGELTRTLDAIGPVLSAGFSPAGCWFASAGAYQVVRVWDTASRKVIPALKGHSGPVVSVAFSPDNRWLATASNDRTAQIWNPTTGELIHTLEAHTRPVRSVAFSPDNRWLATASNDRTVRIWNPTTGELAVTLIPFQEGWAAITPDGRYKLEGLPAGEFWFVAGMCRFEPGELDDYLPALRRLPPDAPLLPPAA